MRHLPEKRPPDLVGSSGQHVETKNQKHLTDKISRPKAQANEARDQQNLGETGAVIDGESGREKAALEASWCPTQGSDIGAKKTAENKGAQEPKSRPAVNRRQKRIEFIRVNFVTVKVTDGKQIKTWDGNTGHRHVLRAVAWIIAVGGGQWIVRHRDTASKPMKLTKARSWCLETIRGIRPTLKRTTAEHIARLNRLHLDAIEPMPTLAEVVAIERETFPPLTRRMRSARKVAP